ncbi:MAG: CoA-transferase [Deltaproteobacteria bacterium]|nr:CoA-transferase [Deltaproteobacteria bacterium]
MSEPFSTREIMIAAAAREIRDGEVVFVGMRLPLVAFAVAKALHAPTAIGVFENGVVRDRSAAQPIVTMSDPPNLNEALSCTGLLEAMSLLQRGRIDLGFIGGAEIDRFGNLNTTLTQGVRLPGSGGAADIASFARRTVIIMMHEQRRFQERVSYCTSPGYGDGKEWRRRSGLPGGGPSKVVTSLGVFGFTANGEMQLESLHPGGSIDAVRANTGWPLLVVSNVTETTAPTTEELQLIRRFDTLE